MVWCQVTRHPRIFRGLTGCQQTPGIWDVTDKVSVFDTYTESTMGRMKFVESENGEKRRMGDEVECNTPNYTLTVL